MHQDGRYSRILAEYRACVEDADRTPSAQVLAAMREQNEEFVDFALRTSAEHVQTIRGWPLDTAVRERLDDEARRSKAEQASMEARDEPSFEAFVDEYFARESTNGR